MEIERDTRLAAKNMEFIRLHPIIFVKYGFASIHVSYPIIPRELLPPSIGYKGARAMLTTDALPTGGLDEFPQYFRPDEALRVWFFRIVFFWPWAAPSLRLGKKSVIELYRSCY